MTLETPPSMWSAADWAIHGPCTLCMHSTSQLLPKEECERSSLLKVLVWTFVYMHEIFQCFMEIHMFMILSELIRLHLRLCFPTCCSFANVRADLGFQHVLHADLHGEFRSAKTGGGKTLREFCLGWSPAIECYLSFAESNATPPMLAKPDD